MLNKITKVKPGNQRHSFAELSDGIEFSIPSRKRWFLIIFIGAWLGGWTIGGIFAASEFVSSLMATNSSGISLFLLFWLFGWAAAEIFASFIFFWQIAGKEIVFVGKRSLVHGRKIFGIGRAKEYEAKYAKELRFSPHPGTSSWERGMMFYGLGNGLLAFDYGAKTIRIVSDVDEAEAKQILKTILQKYPQYAPKVVVS